MSKNALKYHIIWDSAYNDESMISVDYLDPIFNIIEHVYKSFVLYVVKLE